MTNFDQSDSNRNVFDFQEDCLKYRRLPSVFPLSQTTVWNTDMKAGALATNTAHEAEIASLEVIEW